jgi:hypothetical protein
VADGIDRNFNRPGTSSRGGHFSCLEIGSAQPIIERFASYSGKGCGVRGWIPKFNGIDRYDLSGWSNVDADLGKLRIVRTRDGPRAYESGLLHAREQGRIGGRKRKLSERQRAEVLRMILCGENSAAEAARLFSVHRSSISRLLSLSSLSES